MLDPAYDFKHNTHVVQQIDGVHFKLKEPYDFSFLNNYGRVFKVFDGQSSGNVSFGVRDGARRYFIKFAGARPERYENFNGDPASAIIRLKNAAEIYRNLKHPDLIKFINAEKIGGGYAIIFEWEDAAGIEPFGSPENIFMNMPVDKKMRAFESIMKFHAHVAANGYVALDFYEGSILYDPETEKLSVCDIDFYQKSPYTGDLGRICGSARYSSPEEREPGGVMDEITNVYTMGATAFMIFSGSGRSFGEWPLNANLYAVTKRAVSEDRSKRQRSIGQLINEWSTAKK